MIIAYKKVIRKTSELLTKYNPFTQHEPRYRTIADNVATCMTEVNARMKHRKKRSFDMSAKGVAKKFTRKRIRDLVINVDIQRDVIKKHVADIVADFDPRYALNGYCGLTSAGKWILVDAQHIITALAFLCMRGELIQNGKVITDYRDYEIDILYIETDDMAFLVRYFSVMNGMSYKKPQNQYDGVRIATLLDRAYDSATEAEKEISKLVEISEKYNCLPVDTKSDTSELPGAIQHIVAMRRFKGNPMNYDWAMKIHDQYWHYLKVDGVELDCYGAIAENFGKTYCINTSPEIEKLMADIAGIIQDEFGGWAAYKGAAKVALTAWQLREDRKDNANFHVILLLALYKRRGGQLPIPKGLISELSNAAVFFEDPDVDAAEAA